MLPGDHVLYAVHQAYRHAYDGVSAVSELIAAAKIPWISAQSAVLHRMTKPYPKPAFGLAGLTEEVVVARPFVRLVHFVPTTGVRGPRVLVVAPLSGHHATLLRDTVETLALDHDVYLTDWLDARDVPLTSGTFSLDDYVSELRGFVAHLGSSVHVVAVCQPAVPALAAIALDAADGRIAPRSLTLMGGPIDARRNPTAVDRTATDHSLAWFESMLVHRVPAGFAGMGRRVYPGFLQLTAFVMMNPERHLKAYHRYFLARLHDDHAAASVHERFYDEYNAVLDMDAAYYLDTVRTVFQEFALVRGVWSISDQLVEPRAIVRTPVFTIEGDQDDITGLGQTEAALELCSSLPATAKRHHVAEQCGHYGLFSGSRWRTSIYPQVREFIHQYEASRL
jgi:poly(3-hydroxybutyrate) depolymerase